MTRLLIIGAGDLAMEVFSWLPQSSNVVWDTVGFLDDGDKSNFIYKDLLVGKIKGYQPKSDDIFACAIADPITKLRICRELKAKNAIFTNIIHNTSIIASDSRLGEGLIFYPYSYVGTQATVGNFVHLNLYSSIGHNAVVEDGCTLSAHCDLTGHVHLGQGVFMGTHSAVIPGMSVKQFSVLGAGTIVLHNVPERVTILGNPGKVFLRHLENRDISTC